MKNKKRNVIILIVILIAVAGGGFYYLTTRKEVVEEYQMYQVDKEDIYKTISASGTVKGKDLTFYSVKETERVANVLVKEGDAVSAGDVLLTFDIEKELIDLDRKIKEAELEVTAATLRLDTILTPATGNSLLQYEGEVQTYSKNYLDAENDLDSIDIKIEQQIRELSDLEDIFKRHEALYENGALSEREYEESELALKRAEDALDDLYIQKANKENMLTLRKEQLKNAEEKLKNANNALSDDKVKIDADLQQVAIQQAVIQLEKLKSDREEFVESLIATKAGTVKSVNIEAGEYASKGMLLIETEDLSELFVEADVSEFDSIHVGVDQNVQVRSSGLTDTYYSGVVDTISAHAIKKETSSGDEVFVPVTVKLEKDVPFKSGFTVDIDIIIEERNNVISVPIQSVYTNDEEETIVYMIRDGKATSVIVKTGFIGDRRIEIVSGVSEGDEIVFDASVINVKK